MSSALPSRDSSQTPRSRLPLAVVFAPRPSPRSISAPRSLPAALLSVVAPRRLPTAPPSSPAHTIAAPPPDPLAPGRSSSSLPTCLTRSKLWFRLFQIAAGLARLRCAHTRRAAPRPRPYFARLHAQPATSPIRSKFRLACGDIVRCPPARSVLRWPTTPSPTGIPRQTGAGVCLSRLKGGAEGLRKYTHFYGGL